MVYFKITPTFSENVNDIKLSLPTVPRYVSSRDKHYRVYELLREYDLADEQSAIEASSWCELASVGETYETDKFMIEVVEDEEE